MKRLRDFWTFWLHLMQLKFSHPATLSKDAIIKTIPFFINLKFLYLPVLHQPSVRSLTFLWSALVVLLLSTWDMSTIELLVQYSLFVWSLALQGCCTKYWGTAIIFTFAFTDHCFRARPDALDQDSLVCTCDHVSIWFTDFAYVIKSQNCCTQRHVWKKYVSIHIFMGLALVFKRSPNWQVQQQQGSRLTANVSFLSSCQMP